jgi:antitoxin MazE
MQAKLISIGNSRGIRIPKPLIEQAQLTEDVEITVQDNCLIISSPKGARAGWAEAFRSMAKKKHDQLLDAREVSAETEWETKEWEW